jgi:hypothetical protein
MISELIQGACAFDVVEVETKGVIQRETWGVLFVKLQKNQTFYSPHSHVSLAWAFFVLNDTIAHV